MQPSVIDSIPGDTGYSDLWQIVKVVVPANLPVVTSYNTLAALVANNTATLVATQIYVNCPVGKWLQSDNLTKILLHV